LVIGPLKTAEKLPVPETRVPARGPLEIVTRFAGSDHSTPAGTSRWR
jgi:hypothetical protein